MRLKSWGSVRIFYPELDREEVINRARKGVKLLDDELPLKLVVLFGSYAKGNYTVASDVDLLVVYRGEQREDAFALCKRTLNIPRLEPHVYSEREYEEVKQTVDRMIREGVVLFP